MSKIPQPLIDSIKNKSVVLFTGSGFSYGANHPDGTKPPLGMELGEMMADKFLDNTYKTSPLTYISDLAISQTNLFEVQRFIYNIFKDFTPNEVHVKFTRFLWKAIFTTNYDQILEKAYELNKSSIQEINPIYRNTNEQNIFLTEKTVPYYKLHGCISYINDEKLPLILSTEQYISHKINRDRLFSKLKELASDYTFLFIGYSNLDTNIRTILKELESLKDGRPRSYMVAPGFNEIESSYWAERKITTIKKTGQEFIDELETLISQEEMKLGSIIEDGERTIYRKFLISPKEINPTESLLKFIDFEAEFINSSIPSKSTIPNAFYKGYFENWDPILRNLDAERSLKDRILTDIIFEEKYLKENTSYVFSINGFAGSGKSVLLRRLAWDSAITFEKFCLFIKKGIFIRIDPIIELYHYVKERIYIFVDDLIANDQVIINLIDRLEKEQIPVTIIGTSRTNQLNDNKDIQTIIDRNYQLNYLNEREIEGVLDKLKVHKCLGHLEKKTREDQIKELREISGRVLLVALHEATGGKSFEDIIIDEYNSIFNPKAQSIYLTVSILHKLGSYARAGLISRVHEIGFSQFEREFFKPLEYIVFTEKNYTISDYIYKTRHPMIAEMVFNAVLVSEQQRYDEYVRILNHLDLDYNSDKATFLSLTKAKTLKDIFKDPIKVRNLFEVAEQCSPNNAKLLQQMAIYEMSIPGGNNERADAYLKEAMELEPNDPLINHSIAENFLKKAEKAKHYLEKNQLLKQSQNISLKLVSKYPNQAHSYHTILKAKLMQLKDELYLDQNIEPIIKDIEKTLQQTKQRFPEQEFILDIEAKYKEIIEKQPEALSLLEKAFNLNSASPYIAIRYANTLESLDRSKKALDVLKIALNKVPNEKDLSFKYALLVNKINPEDLYEITSLLRRSFTMGDSRYEAQFYYGMALHSLNDANYKNIFEKLSKAKINPDFKNMARTLNNVESKKIFNGIITKLEFNHGYIQRDAFGDRIYFNKSNCINFKYLEVGKRYEFQIGFNYHGPIAINIH
ncbi:SIR2 family protein [Sphingobacterium cavernae]|uniref:SIR2 family protein n=1 Tax=Sphingobacterium cavernae TaxID=2592657 RepID=UPI00122FF78A|nr:SIR2 family protein [Sphingobacterium cavernae]